MNEKDLFTKEEDIFNDSLKVIVLDIENGSKVFDDVRIVKIKSKNYTVMIMLDYAPTIGDLDGDLSILLQSDEVFYKNVKGFYHINNNEMTILLTSNKG